MTQHGEPATDEPRTAVDAAVRVCPRCEATCPPDELRCRRCLTDLRGVPPLTGPEATARTAADRAAADRAARATRRRRRLIAAGLAIAVVAVAGWWFVRDTTPPPLTPTASRGEAAVAGEQWSRANGGARGTRATTAPAPAGADVRWRHEPGATVLALSADDERVYVALADARLVALDARTGEEQWQLAVPGQLDDAPTIVSDRLYIGQRDGRVLALDAASGDVRWANAPREPLFIRHAPLVADGIVWAVTERSLVAFDAETGEVLAVDRFDAGGNATAAVVVGAHLAFSTGSEQRLHHRANGARTFEYPLDGIEHVAAGDETAVAVGASRLLAIAEDARPHWWERFRRQWSVVSFIGIGPEVPSPPREWFVIAPRQAFAPALGDGRVFLADPNGAVRAHELATGDETWVRTDVGARAAPVLTADGLLVPTADALVVLDVATGDERFRAPLEDPPHEVIVTAGGTYVASGAGLEPSVVTALDR